MVLNEYKDMLFILCLNLRKNIRRLCQVILLFHKFLKFPFYLGKNLLILQQMKQNV